METPQELVRELESVMSQTAIAQAVVDMGVETTQPTINRILRGVIKRTSFELGYALMQLHAEKIGKRRPRKTA